MPRKSIREPGHMFLDDLGGDPELAEALGNMLVTWSAAERALLEVLQFLTGMSPNTAYAMYFRIPTFESRVKVLTALADDWAFPPSVPKENIPEDSTYAKGISHAIRKLSSLSLTRNGWVHGSWTYAPRLKAVYVLDHREKVDSPKRRRPTKPGDVNNHADAVKKWTRDLITEVAILGTIINVAERYPKQPAKSR